MVLKKCSLNNFEIEHYKNVLGTGFLLTISSENKERNDSQIAHQYGLLEDGRRYARYPFFYHDGFEENNSVCTKYSLDGV